MEELNLVDVEDSLAGELSNLMTIHLLERRVTAHIQRLKEMKRVSWHAEDDDLVLRTVLVKLRCGMAAVTVQDEKSIRPPYTRPRMSVEVLYPLKT